MPEPEVCAVVRLDTGRPGSTPLGKCEDPAAATVTLGCEHEHIDADRQCAYHAARASEGNYICLPCWDTGHCCPESVIRIEWDREEVHVR